MARKEGGLCLGCNRPNTYDIWCRNCDARRFIEQFDNWTSGNVDIDRFIKDAQLMARNNNEVLEWIPYDRLRNIQYLARGGFSIIYRAVWLDGWISSWSSEEKRWKRNPDLLKDEAFDNAK